MLKARPAGDKNLPIACGRTTVGGDLSYGVFEEATFQAKKAIELNGTDLAHADVSGSKLSVTAENNDVLTPMVGLPTTPKITTFLPPWSAECMYEHLVEDYTEDPNDTYDYEYGVCTTVAGSGQTKTFYLTEPGMPHRDRTPD